ncbi:MAG: hypothetical protein ACTHMJ_13730, partial [Thermomicrobiales bacterium]
TGWLPGDAALPATSDVDVMVVLTTADPPGKPGKFRYGGVLLEVSYLTRDQVRSPEQVLGQSHLAGSFRAPGIIADPTGELTSLQAAVARDFAGREWVHRRCEAVQTKLVGNLQSLHETRPFHENVSAWLFGTGLTTHLLLVAGLRNPTVRRRYVAVRELLRDYNRAAFYPRLLELLGCADMSRDRALQHLAALTEAFDAASAVIKTPFFFASDLSQAARPIAIDGSRDLIARGDQREAVFWLVATYARCQQVFQHDAPALLERFRPGFARLLADLGITSLADMRRRGAEVEAFLPQLWAEAEAIMAANPDII